MGRMGSFDSRELRKLQEHLNRVNEQEINDFVESCAKELAARLLAKVVKRTPVGDYTKEVEFIAKRDGKRHKKGEKYIKRINSTEKKGGILRRGWISKTQDEAESGKGSPQKDEILDYVHGLEIVRSNEMIKIEIANPVEYASYVEFGHRQTPGRYVPIIGKRLKKAWASGKFMMTISEQELREIAPQVLKQKVRKFLEEHMQ